MLGRSGLQNDDLLEGRVGRRGGRALSLCLKGGWGLCFPCDIAMAPDAETAIKVAIERFSVTDPERQRRLIAQPTE